MVKHLRHSLCLAALFAALVSAPASALQDPAAVQQAVEQFLRVQTKGLPGAASYTIGALAPTNQLTPCPALGVSLPPGGRLWGHSKVLVSCQVEGGWSLYLPVQVHILTNYYVASRNLGRGQVLTADDLIRRNGDITELPAGLILNSDEAVGRSLSQALTAGRPVRSDMLTQPWAVQQGQGVRVMTKGPGFQVTSEGRALNNAIEGQVVQVRLNNNGQVISGIARSGGVVEIRF